MNLFLTAIGNFLIGLFKGWLGERSRDKANQTSGEVITENKIVIAAGERAKDARETYNELADLSDADLLERMRRNRERYDARSDSESGTDTGNN